MHIYAWSDGDIPFMHVFTHARTHTHTHINVSRLTCVQQDGSETGPSQDKNDNNQSSTECNHSREEVSTVWTRPWRVEFETNVTATNMVTDYHTTTLPWQQEGIATSYVWFHRISQLSMFWLKRCNNSFTTECFSTRALISSQTCNMLLCTLTPVTCTQPTMR